MKIRIKKNNFSYNKVNAYNDHTGEFLDRMKPGQNYNFDTDLVLEEPVYGQTGLREITSEEQRVRDLRQRKYERMHGLPSTTKVDTPKKTKRSKLKPILPLAF